MMDAGLWSALWPHGWELLSQPVVMAVLGLMVGSFVNVVVGRWPRILERQWWSDVALQMQDEDSLRRVQECGMQPGDPPTTLGGALQAQGQALHARLQDLPPLSLSRPGSHCPACGHRLRVHELIPVVSWLWLRGRCSACRGRISLRYPAVEMMSAALFLLMGWRWEWQPLALLWSTWAVTLLTLALIDWDTMLLPDGLTLPLIWAGLGASALGWTISPVAAIGGATLGWLSLWAVATVFKALTGRDGMGAGDFKLLAAVGAWLGPAMLVPVVLLASLGGAAVGLWMKTRGNLREGRYVPFGPFLAAGGLVVAWVGSQQVLRWWGWT